MENSDLDNPNIIRNSETGAIDTASAKFRKAVSVKDEEAAKFYREKYKPNSTGEVPAFATEPDANKVARLMGFTKTNYTSRGAAVYSDKRNSIFISRDVPEQSTGISHSGGSWKLATTPDRLGSKETRSGTFDLFLENRIGD